MIAIGRAEEETLIDNKQIKNKQCKQRDDTSRTLGRSILSFFPGFRSLGSAIGAVSDTNHTSVPSFMRIYDYAAGSNVDSLSSNSCTSHDGSKSEGPQSLYLFQESCDKSADAL